MDEEGPKGRWSWGGSRQADEGELPAMPVSEPPYDAVTEAVPEADTAPSEADPFPPTDEPEAEAEAAPPRRRSWGGLLPVAVVAAVVGAAAGGGMVAVLDGDDPTTVVRYSGNTSRIQRPEDIQGILAKVQP